MQWRTRDSWADHVEFQGLELALGNPIDSGVSGKRHWAADPRKVKEIDMGIVRRVPRDLDDLFGWLGDFNRNALGEGLDTVDWTPPVDIRETDDGYRIDVELPAVAADDVKVNVKDGVLIVSGERRYEKETEGKVHRIERRYGKFTRSFRLPENVNEDKIDATSKNGVLTLSIAKREEVKPRSIEVKVH
jgi:HSP20 family protein